MEPNGDFPLMSPECICDEVGIPAWIVKIYYSLGYLQEIQIGKELRFKRGTVEVFNPNHPMLIKNFKRYKTTAMFKDASRQETNRLIRGMALKRPEVCDICLAEKPHAHHNYYSDPSDISWLCASCHAKRHSERVGRCTCCGENSGDLIRLQCIPCWESSDTPPVLNTTEEKVH